MLACVLAFVAGYVDVIGFAALFGLFTAHVTGNFIMIGIALTGKATGLLAKVLALPAFVIAVAATRLVESRMVKAGKAPVALLLTAEAFFLLLFLVGLGESPITDPAAPSAIVTGLSAVVAMGIQNALSRTALSELGPTTIMTGNTTQIIIDCVDLPTATGAQREAILSRVRKMAPALAAFVAGAILGALIYLALSMWSVLVPVVLLVAVSIQAWRGTGNAVPGQGQDS
ncbi:MAG: DUF1275 domain-containing protein [Cupriavidus sp.]|nr:DUF1275 domain-containing protein [Cupriavidus sp.]NUT16546.1 DUF1275 domain-containing protein [Cupriavidus sp.]